MSTVEQKRTRASLNALACVTFLALLAFGGCRRDSRWEGHTFTVEYSWDSKTKIVRITDAASNREVADPIVARRVLEEANHELPDWIQSSKLTRAIGVFHIRFLPNGAAEIFETMHGIEGTGSEFIKDPDVTQAMMAAHEGRLDRLQVLINTGDTINAKDQGGHTALMAAVSSHRVEVLRFLLDHGADVNVRSLDGETALTFSVVSGKADMVRELVDRGAFFDCNNAHDREAFLIAERVRYASIISLLKKAGGNCDGAGEKP
jgi:hypothetical protein